MDLEAVRAEVDAEGLRYVVRPLPTDHTTRLFLVVAVPRNTTWRRHTNRLVRQVAELMDPLVAAGSAP